MDPNSISSHQCPRSYSVELARPAWEPFPNGEVGGVRQASTFTGHPQLHHTADLAHAVTPDDSNSIQRQGQRPRRLVALEELQAVASSSNHTSFQGSSEGSSDVSLVSGPSRKRRRSEPEEQVPEEAEATEEDLEEMAYMTSLENYVEKLEALFASHQMEAEELTLTIRPSEGITVPAINGVAHMLEVEKSNIQSRRIDAKLDTNRLQTHGQRHKRVVYKGKAPQRRKSE